MTGLVRRIALTASLVVALAVSSCAGGGKMGGGGVPLSSEEIKTALVGNSIVGDNWDGPYTVYFPVYGELRGLRANHYKDMGTWRAEEDSICATWDNWWGSVERCWGLYIDGDTITWPSAESDAPGKSKIIEGNPYGL
jgi:hypothetical protein